MAEKRESTTVIAVMHDNGDQPRCPRHPNAILFEVADGRHAGKRGCDACLFDLGLGGLDWDKSQIVSYETGQRRPAQITQEEREMKTQITSTYYNKEDCPLKEDRLLVATDADAWLEPELYTVISNEWDEEKQEGTLVVEVDLPEGTCRFLGHSDGSPPACYGFGNPASDGRPYYMEGVPPGFAPELVCLHCQEYAFGREERQQKRIERLDDHGVLELLPELGREELGKYADDRPVWEPSLGLEAGQDSPRLYIFDKDGTLVTKRGGGDPPIPNHVDEQIPLPGVVEKCRELRKAGHTLAIASNQGGVAFGFLNAVEAAQLVQHAMRAIGAETWCMCVHHPKGTIEEYAIDCQYRKPEPGMITLLMQRLDFDAANTIYVGDMESDRQAAEAAGVRFIHADEFFNRKEIQA